MKTISILPLLIFHAVLLAAKVAPAQSPTTLTFENLPDDWTNGYGGLQWTSFAVMDAVRYTNNPSGYSNGIVSPVQVAFNAYAHPAQILRTNGAFNLLAAHLTGAWREQLEVRVQGFLRGTLTYDRTYAVNSTAPRFVNFNWLNVDQVIFSSSGGANHGLPYRGFGTHFVMDNLTISFLPAPTNARLAMTLTPTNTACFCWVDSSCQFRLHESRDVAPAHWEVVTNVPSFSNDTNWLVLPRWSGSRFYRLQL